MHNHIFRLQDIAPIIEDKTGKTIADGNADGRYDAEVVILHDADLIDIRDNGAPANTVYFGDFVLHGYDAASINLRVFIDTVETLSMVQSADRLPIGNIHPCVMFDNIQNMQGCFLSFYGWKITLNP